MRAATSKRMAGAVFVIVAGRGSSPPKGPRGEVRSPIASRSCPDHVAKAACSGRSTTGEAGFATTMDSTADTLVTTGAIGVTSGDASYANFDSTTLGVGIGAGTTLGSMTIGCGTTGSSATTGVGCGNGSGGACAYAAPRCTRLRGCASPGRMERPATVTVKSPAAV